MVTRSQRWKTTRARWAAIHPPWRFLLTAMLTMLLGAAFFVAPPQTASGAATAPLQSAAGQDAAVPYHRRAVYEGVAVDVFLEHVNPMERLTFREGDDVLFRFALTDSASGTPITSVYPAAWMDLRPKREPHSDELAYIRHRGDERVLMILLSEVGQEGQAVPVADFPGGQHPPGRMKRATRAAGMVPAPGVPAMLVSNPEDGAVYFYREGMAAPIGNLQNHRGPRAVLVVDRSLRTRIEPGVYETTSWLRSPGNYDLLFFLDIPRMTYCVDVVIEEDPQLAR